MTKRCSLADRRRSSILSKTLLAVTLAALAGTPAFAQLIYAPDRGVVIESAPVLILPDPTRGPLAILKEGTTVRLWEEKDGWTQVEFPDPQWGFRTGWMLSKYIRPLPPPPPVIYGLPMPTPTNSPTAAARGSNVKLKDVKIHGYVTNVASPTQFDIEDYRIYRDASFVLDLENASPDLTFPPEDIRVGVELEIKGSLNPETGELTARSIKVDLEQFKKQKQTAILSRPPEGLRLTTEGWEGTFFVDGQRLQVLPTTAVVFGLTRTERNLAKQADSPGSQIDFQPLKSLDQITAGVVMTYEGVRRDGLLIADRVEFLKNELESGERRLWGLTKVESKAFNEEQRRPGDLKIGHVGKFKTVPSAKVQEYVSDLGRRLIPAYQKDLPTTDENRIAFQFFVVNNRLPNAFALANGTVVINSGLFAVVENEAQFAAVLGHEIAHAVQEHTWRQQQYHKNVRTALVIGAAVASAYGQYGLRDLANMTKAAIQNGYSRNLENQADRLGLEYMVAAGYDAREAPGVWKAMTKKFGDRPTDFFWSNHDNNATRRSYLMNELKNNYAALDYPALKTNESEFLAISDEVARLTGKKR